MECPDERNQVFFRAKGLFHLPYMFHDGGIIATRQYGNLLFIHAKQQKPTYVQLQGGNLGK